ncbi:hypothetical protein DPMN_166921 [Dreissena polymorpha]|uniref:Uncharacterized protein n=1 Tax=Dreissena polymorpha TaxID=45954 RepID=A0A9D4F0G0_DREPO|nr:hypothetical protein DPMN_166921 [Dreissena polymorpha]
MSLAAIENYVRLSLSGTSRPSRYTCYNTLNGSSTLLMLAMGVESGSGVHGQLVAFSRLLLRSNYFQMKSC